MIALTCNMLDYDYELTISQCNRYDYDYNRDYICLETFSEKTKTICMISWKNIFRQQTTWI